WSIFRSARLRLLRRCALLGQFFSGEFVSFGVSRKILVEQLGNEILQQLIHGGLVQLVVNVRIIVAAFSVREKLGQLTQLLFGLLQEAVEFFLQGAVPFAHRRFVDSLGSDQNVLLFADDLLE